MTGGNGLSVNDRGWTLSWRLVRFTTTGWHGLERTAVNRTGWRLGGTGFATSACRFNVPSDLQAMFGRGLQIEHASTGSPPSAKACSICRVGVRR